MHFWNSGAFSPFHVLLRPPVRPTRHIRGVVNRLRLSQADDTRRRNLFTSFVLLGCRDITTDGRRTDDGRSDVGNQCISCSSSVSAINKKICKGQVTRIDALRSDTIWTPGRSHQRPALWLTLRVVITTCISIQRAAYERNARNKLSVLIFN